METYDFEGFRSVWKLLEAGGFPSLEKIRVKPFWDDRSHPRDEDKRMEDFFVGEDNDDEEMNEEDEGKVSKRYTPFSAFPNLKVFQWERVFNDDESGDSDDSDDSDGSNVDED